MADLPRLHDAILDGDEKTSLQLTTQAITEGADPVELISRWMIPAMDEVGRRFEAQEYFVPELLLAGRAMKGALELLRPLLASTGAQPTGRVVIGTVKGDLHDIGKNMVSSMLEGAGFEVLDLGIDVAPQKFIDALVGSNAHILALSALLSVTMPEMKNTIDAVVAAGLRDRIKIIVGGAPVTQAFADEIGADGYGDNASAAVTVARALMATVRIPGKRDELRTKRSRRLFDS
jgi:5-methyltetrahydrofolate--homocysteine methyltransferase